MTMHLNRVGRRSVKPRSGHQNIIVSGNKFKVRIGSIDFDRLYLKEEIPEAVKFRDQWREKNGYPKADF